jgi:ribosomal protein L3
VTSLRRMAVVLAAAVVAFAAVTLVALEGREVVQVRTVTPEGGVRSTRTWVADADGAMWVEAANVQRPFLLDLRAHPDIELVRGGTVLPVRAVAVPGLDAHRKIRTLLADKYGWADCWVGLLADTSHSEAVRLEPR